MLNPSALLDHCYGEYSRQLEIQCDAVVTLGTFITTISSSNLDRVTLMLTEDFHCFTQYVYVIALFGRSLIQVSARSSAFLRFFVVLFSPFRQMLR